MSATHFAMRLPMCRAAAQRAQPREEQQFSLASRGPLRHQDLAPRLIPRLQQLRQQSLTARRVPSPPTAAWTSDAEVHTEESKAKEEALLLRFHEADTDGNGVIDKEELWALLESTDGGHEASGEKHWLSEDEVTRVMRQYSPSGDVLSFEQFKKLAADGILLDGKVEEYRTAFKAVDSGGNGRISASEIAALFEQLGTPLSYERLVKIMARYDVDKSGQIEFYEFLRMFRDELLDLKEILDYIKMQPQPLTDAEKKALSVRGPGVHTGTVNMLFSEEELDSALKQNPGQLVVLMASLTWCRPCKAFGPPYEKLANTYSQALFLKLNGNENDDTKHLFKDRLKARVTPTFYFFRDGKQVHCHTGANKSRLEFYLREQMPGEELPRALYPPYQPKAVEPVGKA